MGTGFSHMLSLCQGNVLPWATRDTGKTGCIQVPCLDPGLGQWTFHAILEEDSLLPPQPPQCHRQEWEQRLKSKARRPLVLSF